MFTSIMLALLNSIRVLFMICTIFGNTQVILSLRIAITNSKGKKIMFIPLSSFTTRNLIHEICSNTQPNKQSYYLIMRADFPSSKSPLFLSSHFMSFPSYRCFYVKFPQADKRILCLFVIHCKTSYVNPEQIEISVESLEESSGYSCTQTIYILHCRCFLNETIVLLLRNNLNCKGEDQQAKLKAQKDILFEMLLLITILVEKINPERHYRILSAESHFKAQMKQQPPRIPSYSQVDISFPNKCTHNKELHHICLTKVKVLKYVSSQKPVKDGKIKLNLDEVQLAFVKCTSGQTNPNIFI